MKAQLVEVEKPMTVAQLLEQEGLDKNLYFVSVNGEVAQLDSELKSTDQVRVIPAVAGG